MSEITTDNFCHEQCEFFARDGKCPANGLPERCQLYRLRMDYPRLCELAEADKDGRLVVLPCKVGTSVFDISDGTAYETSVLNFVVGRDGVSCKTVSSWPDVSEFGTRIFLTREAAEAAMEGAEHGRD